MSNLIKYWFFNLYNWYYKDGNGRDKTPTQSASAAMAMCIGLWIILITFIYTYIVNHSFHIPYIYLIITITLVLMLLIEQLFLKNDLYQKIYDEYKPLDFGKRKTKGRFFAIFFSFLPAIINTFLTLYWHNIIKM